ncbi:MULTISPECIES: hypothetical protein [unclassified Rhodococcus (in: high G+C Gram-positive bacteria)]|uniref:TRAFAC clade GTPase domain-containing protein n=1 Tax=unclassified Rhodococcus (in: high G+C Gram-positive bacteria) TaxID=192944 RepID=UPI0016448348|nr:MULTISPECIES: hypothetical protein [unclassified Rhodococcus (in: high G+C Gram-positive bacteria)]MDJ0362435.1 hypothetical protein [Rhodococcus sp. H29-C3]
MTKCPRCFNHLSPEWFAWTAETPTETESNKRASAYSGVPVVMGTTIELRKPENGPPDWTPTPNYAEEQLGRPAVDLCPICHFKLPAYWRWGNATCITMAGARATGKTVYIAVMIKQLQRLVERQGQSVDPANQETERNYREFYERPLYEERGLLEPTPTVNTASSYQRDPLIFSLGIWQGVKQYLVIRDVAGEDLENANTEGHAWHFFGLADAVLFLFDPLRVEEIAHQLMDLIPMQGYRGGDPRVVFRTVTDLINRQTPRIAMILSKFDALQALQNVNGSQWSEIMSNPGAAFSRDPGMDSPTYNEDDGRLLHEEVSSLLQRLDAGPVIRSVTNTQTGQAYPHRFFAVSALGDSPVGSRLHDNGISPFRCLDPIRWVLSANGVL